MLAAVLTGILWISSILAAQAEHSVTLAWDSSPSDGVAGYNIYALEENTLTPACICVGDANQATVLNLKEGVIYSFTVTAYNVSGLESLPSATVNYMVPVPLALAAPVYQDGLWRIQFQGAPGHSYDLEASTDLNAWSIIWQTGPVPAYGPLEFVDPQSSILPSRFYRLVER